MRIIKNSINKKILIKKIFVFLLITFLYFFYIKRFPLSQSINLSPTEVQYSRSQNENLSSILIDLFKIFFSVPTSTTSESEIKDIEITPSSSSLNQPNKLAAETPTPTISNSLPVVKESYFSSLREIFNEVGIQTGVPPAVLEAVLQVEMPSVFRYTPEQIRQYSLPGNVIPDCQPNVCSATGPMQMTIGRDADNNPLCPKCCWQGSCLDTKGGCPNAWAIYGQGEPCNLKDNIAAAARKLKNDSRSLSATDWSEDEVYRASYRYYGNCTVKYPRLGDRTYCEYVWWYYQTVQ